MTADYERVLAAARHVSRVNEWLWRAQTVLPVSYPPNGHDTFATIEEQSYWFRHRNACIAAVLGRFRPPGVIVDVGGGNGGVTRYLRSRGFGALLLEPGDAGVATARGRGLAPIVQSTFEAAGFEPGSVPAFGFFDTLEHIDDDLGTLRSVAGALQPHGRIYVSVPAMPWLWSAEDDYAGHYRRYRARELAAVLDRAGFRVEFVSYLFASLVTPLLLARTLPTRVGLRKAMRASTTRREHGLTGPWLARAAGASLAWEIRWLSAARSIPIGTSCMAVAAKR